MATSIDVSQIVTIDMIDFRYVSVNVSENDSESRHFYVRLNNNGEKYEVPSNVTARVKYAKSDGHIILNDCDVVDEVVINGTLVHEQFIHIVITEQMSSYAGKCSAQLLLIDSNTEKAINSMPFYIYVRSGVYNDDSISSTNEFKSLSNALIRVDALEVEINEAEEIRETNEATRQSNEATRQSNEETRQSQEADRQAAESVRQTNENTRISNENTRISQETDRESNTAQAIVNTQNATSEANTATSNANAATAASQEQTRIGNTLNEELISKINDNEFVLTAQLGNPTQDIQVDYFDSDSKSIKQKTITATGVATLDTAGKVPVSQLPGFVSDVFDVSISSDRLHAFDKDGNEVAGEGNKIYIDSLGANPTQMTFRWSGSIFAVISEGIVIGSTEGTAYEGSKGVALEGRVTALEETDSFSASNITFDNTKSDFFVSANVQDALDELTAEASESKKGLMTPQVFRVMEACANVKEVPLLLKASMWVGDSAPFTQSVTITEDLSPFNNGNIVAADDISASQLLALVDADISSIIFDGTVNFVFTANQIKPSIDIPLKLVIASTMNVVEVPEYVKRSDVAPLAEDIAIDSSQLSFQANSLQDALEKLDHKINVVSQGSVPDNDGLFIEILE